MQFTQIIEQLNQVLNNTTSMTEEFVGDYVVVVRHKDTDEVVAYFGFGTLENAIDSYDMALQNLEPDIYITLEHKEDGEYITLQNSDIEDIDSIY